GFVSEYTLSRFEGTPPPSAPVPGVQTACERHLDGILQLDRAVTATDRSKVLRRFLQEQPDAVRVVERGGQVDGFLMARRGARAWQIGPCLARDGAGEWLLADAWHRYAGQTVFLDVPLVNAKALAVAAATGLSVQRHLLRMCRGERIGERPEELWASSGPEKG